MIDIETLKVNAAKPVHMTDKGELFIDGEEFPYPVEQGSVSVKQWRGGKLNLLTLTFIVGNVQIDRRIPPELKDG